MPAIDRYAGSNVIGARGPSTFAENVTPSDSADLTNVSTRIYIGATGHMRFTPLDVADGSYVLMSNLAVGYHDIRAKRIWSTGTTATLIVALA